MGKISTSRPSPAIIVVVVLRLFLVHLRVAPVFLGLAPHPADEPAGVLRAPEGEDAAAVAPLGHAAGVGVEVGVAVDGVVYVGALLLFHRGRQAVGLVVPQ